MNIAIKPETVTARKSLKGRVSLVTGSTSGIGLGIARALAAAGSDIVLHGFGKPEIIADAQSEIVALNVRVFHSAADMAKPEAIREMIEATLASFGRLDILVNNAGIQHVAPLQDFPVEKWDAILAINLSSAFHTSRLALPSMLNNKWGRIINIVSAHGLVGSPFKSAYVAAKHGIVGLTRVIALETAERGVTCNAICPGYVYTPLVEAQIDGQAKAHGVPREQVIRDVLLAQQPNKRFATVDELGALAVFLAGDAAASITGVALPVDGGWTVREGIRRSLEADGRTVEDFATCEAFLEAYRPGREGCLLVDAYLPAMTGHELLQHLHDRGYRLPAIMITGNSDVQMAVEAMKAGASDFIEKPVGRGELLASVERALEQSRDATKLSAWRRKASERVGKLTSRQRQIMEMVLAGHPSKNIAADLRISQRTVENHRASIMKKMGAK